MENPEVPLALFDKGGGNFTGTAADAARVLEVDYDPYYKSYQPDLCQYDLVIAHIRNPDWKKLIDKSAKGTVRLRVSTGGYPDAEQPHQRPDGVCVFHLIPDVRNLSEDFDAWKRIIEGLSNEDTVSDLIAGEGRHQVASYFIREEIAVLPALSILCQGCLAVHAEGYNIDNEKWAPQEISSALNQMGWSNDIVTGDLRDKREEVRNPAWWHVSNGEEDPIEKAKDEWELDPTEEGWDAVRKLLRRVTGNNERPLTDDDLGMVAEAYCALVERLGGSPCQA